MTQRQEIGADAERELVVSRVIEGPRDLVFDAFTTVERLTQWWGPRDATVTTRAFDFRPGGVWDATIQSDRGAFPNYVEWKEIVRPERIVWLYGSGKDDPNAVLTTLTLADHGSTTEATLRLRFPSREVRETATKHGAEQGARQSLDALAGYIAAR